MSLRGRIALAILGLGLEGWTLASLDPLPGADLGRHVTLFLVAWACYVAAIAVVIRSPRAEAPSLRFDLVLIFFIGLLLRATFLTTSPSLSDDVFRSVWDARLIWHGVNPYLYPPGAPELAPYRDDLIWPRVNAKEQRTPYLPLSEELGAVTYALLPERTLPFQVTAAGMDLMAAGLMAWLLARLGQDPRRALVLAWSPAGVLQFAHSGHNDAALVLALVVAALLLSFGRGLGSLLALAAGVMVKAVPALAFPVFGRAAGWWRIVPALALSIATVLPFGSAAPVLLSGLVEEGSESQFNDSFHWLAERAARAVTPDHASAAASVLGGVILLIAMVWATQKVTPLRPGSSPLSVQHAILAGCQLTGLYLIVAPVVQPWYFTWLAPLIALSLAPGEGRMPFAGNSAVAWLWLSGASILSDLSYLPDGASLWPVIRLIEYGPFYALFVWAAFNARRALG